jgi:hypothetical protein
MLSFLLAGYIWVDGGLVFSPGKLTDRRRADVILQGYASHAEFERQCSLCHRPFEARLGDLCLACHKEISNQLAGAPGIHSRIANVRVCQECHPDHHGRDFNPTQAATRFFDHSITTFSLIKHQFDYDSTPMECMDCHQGDDYSQVLDAACGDCHGGADPEFIQAHRRDYGENCLGCHDGADRMATFDHAATGFPIDGKHVSLVCSSCHLDGQLAGIPSSCEGCHAEPVIHRGLFDPHCAGCHNTQGWTPALINGDFFDHFQTTGFSLVMHTVDYSGAALQCTTCHPVSLTRFDKQVCIDCHSQADAVFMTDHQIQFGPDCLGCHDGVDRMSGFDHAQVFPLEGRHQEIACVDCHVNQVFAGTPGQCYQCHAEPEIHAGVFGLECQDCHTSLAWSPATLLVHSFPLDHGLARGSQPTACATCHPANYIEYTCYGCHEHQPENIASEHSEEGISAAELPACVSCHPTGLKDEGDD